MELNQLVFMEGVYKQWNNKCRGQRESFVIRLAGV